MNIVNRQSFNSNNSWGFGGWTGYEETYDNGIILRVGRNHHRHTGTSSANAVYVKIDDDFSISVLKSSRRSHLSSLKGVSVISVWEYDGHYIALAEDVDVLEKYGWNYNKIKTIQICQR